MFAAFLPRASELRSSASRKASRGNRCAPRAPASASIRQLRRPANPGRERGGRLSTRAIPVERGARGVRSDPHDRDVPTVSRFHGIVIAMFFDDHGYPHFHARHAAGEAKVRIDNLEVIDSELPRRQLRLVLAWAELHQEELAENWRRARAGETLKQIEPLQ
jgi:hypothetical protein